MVEAAALPKLLTDFRIFLKENELDLLVVEVFVITPHFCSHSSFCLKLFALPSQPP